MRNTRTFTLLSVSQATYDEIHKLLFHAGYDHAFIRTEGVDHIDMNGIALEAPFQNDEIVSHLSGIAENKEDE